MVHSTTATLAAVAISLTAVAADVRHEWVSFDTASQPPVEFETKLPAEASLTDGPDGHRAVTVTAPGLDRDEKACAFHLRLPPMTRRCNGLQVWVKGSSLTKRLEIVLRTTAGDFALDTPVGEQWSQVMLGRQNVHPWFSPETSELDLEKATAIRFCFGAWQGHTGGPHEVSIGPIAAAWSPLLQPARPPEVIGKPTVPLPFQPFTIELLDLARGRWQFQSALGARLSLADPVTAYAFAGAVPGQPRLAYLCCDPEFPEELSHAVLKVIDPVEVQGGTCFFRIDEPCLSCGVSVAPRGQGAFRCELGNVQLGPPTPGDQYVTGLYLLVGGTASPVWLVPPEEGAGPVSRLLTVRVGNVFVGDEPATAILALICPDSAQEAVFTLEATDYATGEVVWRGKRQLGCAAGAMAQCQIELPVERFGILRLTAVAGALRAEVRLCRVPTPRRVDPDRSMVGINLFQQQIWWYAHQVPLMANAGVRWLRPWLAWENTWSMQQPTRESWDTRPLDAALRRMDAFDQRYEYILFAAPKWVAEGARNGVPPVARLGEWADWVTRLVTKYRGRIQHYEVWNEPDLMWPESTRHAGEHYLGMLEATWTAAKSADPHCVIDGLSHAGYQQWLENVGRLGASRYLDVATIHTYAGPKDFPNQVRRRQALLHQYGMGDKALWINEIGATAYDFSPEYSAKFHCSEKSQARTLMLNYAQALWLAPGGRVFWFCTYDPRDAATESQWAWDAGIGVLYLGFLPKLSYVALAGVAQELDGRRCLGRADVSPALHQISFEGPVSVVWHDDPAATPLPATELGCSPDEAIRVKDSFANEVAAGRAGNVQLALSRGPFYVEGSRQMAARAQAQESVQLDTQDVALSSGSAASVSVSAPGNAVIRSDVPAGLPVAVRQEKGAGRTRVWFSAAAAAPRASGSVRLFVAVPGGTFGLEQAAETIRTIRVCVGEPNLVRDAVFDQGNVDEWAPERTSPYAWDSQQGHAHRGSLRLDGPFDRRLVHWGVSPDPARPLRFVAWVKTDALVGCSASLDLALFAKDKWLVTWRLAATPSAQGNLEHNHHLVPGASTFPQATSEWTCLEAQLQAGALPEDTAKAALYVDLKGGTGRVWLDDVDLWQPTAP